MVFRTKRRKSGRKSGKSKPRKGRNGKKKPRKSQTSRKFAQDTPKIVNGCVRFSPGRSLKLIPFKVRDVITYREQIVVEATPTAGSVTFVMRGNGPYDPNQTGTGGQPKGFDNYMALYNEHYVVKSKCTVLYTLHSGTSSYVLVLRPFSDAAGNLVDVDYSAVSTDQWPGYRHGKVMIPSVRDTHQSIHKLEMTMSTAKALGRTHPRANVIGTSAAFPTTEWYWRLSRNYLDATPAGSVNISIQMIVSYDCIFSDPVSKSLN